MEAINICINGQNRQVPTDTTLSSLIELFNLKGKSIAFELNRRVIERASYATTRLNENDAVEIVHFVGGG